MPGNQTNQRASMIPYHISSFIGGQSDYEDKGIKGSFKSGMNLDVRKQIDSLSCQFALKDDLALGIMTGAPKFVVPASDGNTYFFLDNGDIWRRNSSGSYLIQGHGIQPVYTDTHESGIIGAAEWYDSSGFTYLVWATATRLNIKKILGTSYTNTEPWNDVNTASTGSWPKTNLTSTDLHTMAMANGALQICNGNVMALVGYDLSYTNNSLQLIPGNNARCVLERGKYAVIGCRRADKKDESAFFDWDGLGLSWNDKEIIKFSGLNAMIDTELALAQIGTNGQLYVSDFNTPMPFRQIRGGGQANVDGMASYHGMALMGIFNNTNKMDGHFANGIYTIGRVNKNAPLILNLDYQLDCDEIYSVKVIGSDIICTYRLNGQYGVKIVDTGTYARAVYQSLDLVAPLGSRRYPIPLGRILDWNRIDLQCKPMPPGTAIEIWYRMDKSDTFIQANMEGGGVQFNTKNMQNAVFYVGEKGRVTEVQAILIPSGNRTPEIYELNFYFSVG